MTKAESGSVSFSLLLGHTAMQGHLAGNGVGERNAWAQVAIHCQVARAKLTATGCWN